MKETFLLRAKENFKTTEMLFDAGLYNAFANRAYYSAFHLATAYLFYKGYTPIVDHRNVLSLFTSEFINKRKVFPSITKNYLYDLQSSRADGDYKGGVNKTVTKYLLKIYHNFFNIVIKEIENETQS